MQGMETYTRTVVTNAYNLQVYIELLLKEPTQLTSG